MPKVNPEILAWARETAGLTLEDATKKLRISDLRDSSAVNRLIALEKGDSEPTRPVLVKMAKQYQRPLLAFYMPAPPLTADLGHDFRTLPGDCSGVDNGRVDALLRDVCARQGIVRDALEFEEKMEPLSFINSCNTSQTLESVITSLQELLNITVEEFRKQDTPEKGFKLLRTKAEDAGIYVLLIGNLGSHHTNISVEAFRGFAIADDVAPFVVINPNDAKTAWSFTLLHEIVHLLLGKTGISGMDSDYEVERFCNDVASGFLLSTTELDELQIDDLDRTKESISMFAGSRNISNTMVAYKLYRADKINFNEWQQLKTDFSALWRKDKEEKKNLAGEKKGGPNQNVIRKHRVGKPLMELAKRMMAEGVLSTSRAAIVLGVKPVGVTNMIR